MDAASTSDNKRDTPLSADSAHAPIVESDVVAYVETDRYCPSCGYNLITRPVFREPRTRLLLARCAECGEIHPANLPNDYKSVWLQRVAIPLLGVWLLALLGVTFVVGVIETAMHAVTLESLTEWSRPGRVINEDFEEYGWFMTLVLTVSTLIPLAQITLLSAVAHHWKRWGYLMAAALLPVVPLTISFQMWRHEAPNLMEWGVKYMVLHFAVQVGAGVIGALYGRKIMRGVATLLMPPRVRTMMSFLWLADDLAPPVAPPKRKPR